MTTLQMAGVLFGGIAGGQLAEMKGRKPLFVLSIFILMVGNGMAAFSVSWQMFTVCRFIIGVGCGIYLCTWFVLSAEYISNRWRTLVVAIPSWSIWASMMGLIAWQLPDWKHIHIATAGVCAPFLLTWWFIPESFRWLVANGRLDEAEQLLVKIAKRNGRSKPNFEHIRKMAEIEAEERNNNAQLYSFITLFKTRTLLKHTLLVGILWLACDYSYYSIAFGIEELSGNLYLNMFLISIVEIPSQFTLLYLNNRVGRKRTAIGFMIVAAIGAFGVATVQYVDTSNRALLTNTLALTSKIGVATFMGAIQIMTSEIYPTVVRTIGFSWGLTAARVGAMAAPQIVFLGRNTPGLLYVSCGGIMLASIAATCFLPETSNKVIEDFIVVEEKNISTIAYPDLEKPGILSGIRNLGIVVPANQPNTNSDETFHTKF